MLSHLFCDLKVQEAVDRNLKMHLINFIRCRQDIFCDLQKYRRDVWKIIVNIWFCILVRRLMTEIHNFKKTDYRYTCNSCWPTQPDFCLFF